MTWQCRSSPHTPGVWVCVSVTASYVWSSPCAVMGCPPGTLAVLDWSYQFVCRCEWCERALWWPGIPCWVASCLVPIGSGPPANKKMYCCLFTNEGVKIVLSAWEGVHCMLFYIMTVSFHSTKARSSVHPALCLFSFPDPPLTSPPCSCGLDECMDEIHITIII